MRIEDAPPDLDYSLYEDFYHSLVSMYVSLVDSPFVLERFCMTLFRQERFSSHFDLEMLREVMDDLQF
jgi:hypothetical protein